MTDERKEARSLVLKGGEIGAEELSRLAEKIWLELRESSEARAAAAAKGIDISAIDFEGPSPIEIRSARAGIDPFTAGVLVSFGTSLAASTVVELFKSYVVPRIREMRGRRAVGDE